MRGQTSAVRQILVALLSENRRARLCHVRGEFALLDASNAREGVKRTVQRGLELLGGVGGSRLRRGVRLQVQRPRGICRAYSRPRLVASMRSLTEMWQPSLRRRMKSSEVPENQWKMQVARRGKL